MDIFSNIGTHTSSVQPGKTVDSKITRFPFCNLVATDFVAEIKIARSGWLSLSTGVGVATIKTSELSMSLPSNVNRFFNSIKASSLTSLFKSLDYYIFVLKIIYM